jgi:Domain of unknown function (DUF4365)
MAGVRPRIEFQAKATALEAISEDHLTFALSLKNYEELGTTTLVPRILVVVALPNNSDDWLSVTEAELSLRRCGYWLSLSGYPPTQNTTSVTVKLPRTQIFNVQQLSELMSRAEKGPL